MKPVLLLLLLLAGSGLCRAQVVGATEAMRADELLAPTRAPNQGDIAGGGAKLELWVPPGQERQAALAASEWQDELSDRSAVVVREAADDDGELGDAEDDGVAMSPSWLRGAARLAEARADRHNNWLAARIARSPVHLRRKRAASPGPNEASSEDASVAADSSRKVPAAPAQVKAGRSHQFVTGRTEKEPPPVVREVEAHGAHGAQGAPRPAQAAAPAPAPPTHASPVAAGSSRVGAGRDALGLRVDDLPHGPRYSSVYELETLRHGGTNRHYAADNYGSHNAYATSYGGNYGNGGGGGGGYGGGYGGGGGGGYGGGGYGSGGYGGGMLSPYAAAGSAPVTMGRNTAASSATPRRIIYYASLPDPAPAPHHHPMAYAGGGMGGMAGMAGMNALPGASRVPHEYRGPPYDVNGAYANDGRYPPPPPGVPGDNPYRYTIIDAEPPGPHLGGFRPNALPTLPALSALPYRERLPAASPAPAAYPQPYRISAPSSAAPPPPPAPPLPSPTADAGPQAASPIQYTQYDYNGIGARTATATALLDSKQGLGPVPPGVPLSDDPYRGFNPRQPAPWSMQVGTRLTVKDDGYGGASSQGGLPAAARRFYVTSQQKPGYGDPMSLSAAYAPAPARFPRPLDRERSGGGGRPESRNRLYR